MACRGRSNRNSQLYSLRPILVKGGKTIAIHGCEKSLLSHGLHAVMRRDCMLER